MRGTITAAPLICMSEKIVRKKHTGQAGNKGEFGNHNRPEAPTGILQVNTNWQIDGQFGADGGADGTFYVGADLLGEGYTERIQFYRFPAGWRSTQLAESTLPAVVKTAIRKAVSNWP
jgi:hypothetical protein